jgi:hypothetical protein
MTTPAHNPFGALRSFVRPRPAAERCELCGAALASEHPHLIEPATRRLLCSCDACSLLFANQAGGRFRKLPTDVTALERLRLSDAQWQDLCIPINLAFFFHSSPAGKVVALYPSPAGATEASLPPDAWQALVDENPVLAELQPDVEALLINRIRAPAAYYRLPIDECYKLVGLIRTNWRGLSGGPEVWTMIDEFFGKLAARAQSHKEADGT